MSGPSIPEAIALLQLNDGLEFTAATELLFKIVQNIIKQPDEAKFRSLKRSGAAFSKAVGSAKGGVRFLKAVGFVEEGSGDEAALVLPAKAPTALLEQGKASLKQAVQQRAAQLDAERSKANADAAEKLAQLKAVSKANNSKRDAEAERERQRLLSGIALDNDENETWKKEYDAMKGGSSGGPTSIK